MAEILQISDTHGDGIPVEDILNEYEEGDLDAIVHTGDATQKPGVEGGQSLGFFERSIGQLGYLSEELGAESYFIPGNHDPVRGAMPNGVGGHDDDEFIGQAEQAYAEENEDYDPEEDDFYEKILEENGVEDLRNSSAEVGDATIVGGNHHHGPREDFIPELEAEDIYDEERLEGVAEELGGREGGPELYEWLKQSPWGGFNDIVETVGGWLGYEKEIEVDPAELTLEEIPEEFRSDQHKAYEQAKEQWDEAEDFKRDSIIENINEAEGEVIVFDHGLPYSDETDVHPDDINEDGDEPVLKGSRALKEVFQEKGDDIGIFGGGHFHKPERIEMYGVDVVNSATAYSHISYDGESYEVEQTLLEELESVQQRQEQQQRQQREQMTQEEMQQRRQKIVRQVMEDQGFETEQEAMDFIKERIRERQEVQQDVTEA